MKLTGTITALVALVVLAFSAQAAQAEPEHELVFGEISVEVHGGGKVTGTSIDCGADCYDDDSWFDNQLPPKNRLTATAERGWAFGGWQGCTSINGQSNVCDATYSELGGEPIIASFYDVMAPSVFLQYPAMDTVAGDTLHAAVESGDNDRVAKVEYLIDGQVVKTVESGGIDVYIDVTGVSEGEHQIQARAYDPTGNNGITGARTFTVDHSGPNITLNAPVVATNADSPAFSFGTDSTDVKETSCAIVPKGDDASYEPCSPNEPFAGPGLAEGEWIFTVWATDNVGNLTQVVHDFVVDRTAPVAEFTSGPADGATVKPGEVSYGWSATDGLAIAQHCSWDGAEAVSCDGSSAKTLAAGDHTFAVSIVDQAGNETTLTRTLTAKKSDGPGPDPDPDPDTGDKTAPVVKLVAPKQTVKSVRKALRLKVRCDEACSGNVLVKGKAGVKFAGRVYLAGPGVAKLKLKPNKVTRKRLTKLANHILRPKALKLTASASLKDKSGNTGKATLKFRVAG